MSALRNARARAPTPEGRAIDPILVVSPHLDDAVLSLGQFLAGWPGAFVMTVFGGMPDPAAITIYDVNSGFRDSTEAIVARNHEDDRAMHVLQARQMRAALFDNQYRTLGHGPTEPHVVLAQIQEVVLATLDATKATRLYAPLGLAHPDHVLVADACVNATRKSPHLKTWLYEEIPARVTDPELVFDRLTVVRQGGFSAKLDFVGTGPLETKRAAIGCYESQLWALDPNLLYVPERVWALS